MILDSPQIFEKRLQNNVAFLLDNEFLFSKTAYKIMQNDKKDILIKCIQSKTNGKVQLTYLSEDLLSFEEICGQLNEEQLLGTVLGLLRRVKTLSEYGYLDFSCLVVELDKVFVDTKTLDTKFVYIPFQNGTTTNQLSVITNLRANLIKRIQFTSLYINGAKRIIRLVNLLADGTLSLDLLIRSLGLLTGKIVDENEHKSVQLVMVNKKSGHVIKLTETELVLGRTAPTTKGTIADTRKLIGRQHCKITRKGNETFVTDLKSANGTYLNGKRLEPQKMVRISEGDVLMLAYAEFSIKCVETEDAI